MNESVVIKTLEKQLAHSQRTNEILQQQIEKNNVLITKLQNQLDVLLRTLYGKKSEKSSKKNTTPPNHGSKDETSGMDDTPPNRRNRQTSSEKKASGRKPLPPDLPRIVVTHDIPASEKTCACCGQERKRFSQCITEQLDFVPAHLVVKQHIRYKYHCPCSPQEIKTAPLPAQPIDKGLAGPGLLADILISKFQDALPLYRQKQRFKRHGLDIADSTLCDWVGQCAQQLKPLVLAMKSDALTSKKLHVDDTPLPLLDRGKTKKGRLWIYLANGPQTPQCVIYDYTKTRSRDGPGQFLADYTGFLQADAYSGYDALYQEKDIIEVGCLAHMRRKFYDVAQAARGDSHAQDVIAIIAELYAVESEAKTMTDHERYYYRKKKAKPTLKKLHHRLKQLKKIALPSTPFQKAVDYALNHWIAFMRYLSAGYLDIDNNAAERGIRPLVIGRKNYLFVGSHQGGHNAAIIYSLIETCKINGVNPFEYLRDVLTRLPTTLQKNIRTLLPYHWQPQNA